jgi:hypothetical protein
VISTTSDGHFYCKGIDYKGRLAEQEEILAAVAGSGWGNLTGVREKLGADWGLAETGAAGPTGNRYGDAAGHSCIAVVGPGVERVITLETGSADRRANMRRFAQGAFGLAIKTIG